MKQLDINGTTLSVADEGEGHPVLLVHGVEGIAVGLSTKILPHNFVEIIKSSIAIIKYIIEENKVNQKIILKTDSSLPIDLIIV